MNTNEYRRNVYKTLSIKPAKVGLRLMLRKRATLNIGHATVGFATEAIELCQGLLHYLSGESQLKEEMRVNAREELGDLFYYASVLSKELNAKVGGVAPKQKIKLPGAGKKIKLAGTLTTNVLLLLGLAGDLLDAYKKVYYGREIDIERVRERFILVIPYLYGVTYAMFGEPPVQILVENIAKLQARYPAGFFDAKAEKDRDLGKEAGAAKAVKKAVPNNFKKAKAPSAKAAA